MKITKWSTVDWGVRYILQTAHSLLWRPLIHFTFHAECQRVYSDNKESDFFIATFLLWI